VSHFKALYEKGADLGSRIRAVEVLNKQCDGAAALLKKNAFRNGVRHV
jgi:hypothetical protein